MIEIEKIKIGEDEYTTNVIENAVIRNGHSPYISDNNTWVEWDDETQEYVDTGVVAKGQKGDKGDKGDTGAQGIQGVPGQNGRDGVDGSDYVITESDYQAIGEIATSDLSDDIADMIEVDSEELEFSEIDDDATSTETTWSSSKIEERVSFYLGDSKEKLANAITSKGVDTSASDSFDTMATNIGNISSGGEDVPYMTKLVSNSELSNTITVDEGGLYVVSAICGRQFSTDKDYVSINTDGEIIASKNSGSIVFPDAERSGSNRFSYAFMWIIRCEVGDSITVTCESDGTNRITEIYKLNGVSDVESVELYYTRDTTLSGTFNLDDNSTYLYVGQTFSYRSTTNASYSSNGVSEVVKTNNDNVAYGTNIGFISIVKLLNTDEDATITDSLYAYDWSGAYRYIIKLEV